MSNMSGEVYQVKRGDVIDFGPNTQRVKVSDVAILNNEVQGFIKLGGGQVKLDLSNYTSYVFMAGVRDVERSPGQEKFIGIFPPDVPVWWHFMPRDMPSRCLTCREQVTVKLNLVEETNPRRVCEKCGNLG